MVALQARSAISNGTRALPGINGRSAGARRHRDLVASLTAELVTAPTAVQRAMISQAAGLIIKLEQLNAAVVNGEHVDANELANLTNACTTILQALGISDRLARTRARESRVTEPA